MSTLSSNITRDLGHAYQTVSAFTDHLRADVLTRRTRGRILNGQASIHDSLRMICDMVDIGDVTSMEEARQLIAAVKDGTKIWDLEVRRWAHGKQRQS